MYRMMEKPAGQDFLLASGTASTVEDFLMNCFKAVEYPFSTNYLDSSIDKFRKIDPANLIGDPTKALSQGVLNHTRTLEQIAFEMVEWDIKVLKDGANPYSWGLNDKN
jgi:GDP-D-mannose dehydratase